MIKIELHNGCFIDCNGISSDPLFSFMCMIQVWEYDNAGEHINTQITTMSWKEIKHISAA